MVGRLAAAAVIALLGVGVAGCGSSIPAARSAPNRAAASGPVPLQSQPTVDRRGHGLVALDVHDNGKAVLVDIGQQLVLTLDPAPSPWATPYVEGPKPQTGQDRVLYLQDLSGYPTTPAGARIRAGNPGIAVLTAAPDPAACPAPCGQHPFRVTLYVGVVPGGSES
jgi:hypothetical protein